jgi:hypothetical protein
MRSTKHRFGLHTSQVFRSCAISMRSAFALLYAESAGIGSMGCPSSDNVSIVTCVLSSMDVLLHNHMIFWHSQAKEWHI